MKIEVDLDVDQIVIGALKDYYNLVNQYDKIDCSDDVIDPDTKVLRAIEVVLKDYLTKEEYDAWQRSLALDELAKIDVEML
jgi:hypothetical protein